jgi:hypothetical protein
MDRQEMDISDEHGGRRKRTHLSSAIPKVDINTRFD